MRLERILMEALRRRPAICGIPDCEPATATRGPPRADCQSAIGFLAARSLGPAGLAFAALRQALSPPPKRLKSAGSASLRHRLSAAPDGRCGWGGNLKACATRHRGSAQRRAVRPADSTRVARRADAAHPVATSHLYVPGGGCRRLAIKPRGVPLRRATEGSDRLFPPRRLRGSSALRAPATRVYPDRTCRRASGTGGRRRAAAVPR